LFRYQRRYIQAHSNFEISRIFLPFKTFFDSDAAKELGKFVGELIKSVIVVLSDMTGFASQMGTSKLAEGFMEGFGQDGIKALKKLFSDIYGLIFKALTTVLQKLPWEAYVLVGLALFIPASIAGVAMAIAHDHDIAPHQVDTVTLQNAITALGGIV
jgi:hypothetical protein